MFYRKSKRIKELEIEVSELNYKLQLLRAQNWNLETNRLELVNLCASIETPLPGCEEYGKKEIAYLLGKELEKQKLIKYSKEYNPILGIWVLRGAIRVVRS